MNSSINVKKALLDPSSVFATPAEVINASDLTREQKIEILQRWEYGARELQVAADENMGDDAGGLLSDVLTALHQLGTGANLENSPPTKQGGK